MFIHHNATVVLIVMSYITNHVRIGCLIILVHDSADYLLEVGRKYDSWLMKKR
jgi:ceramide synthetase